MILFPHINTRRESNNFESSTGVKIEQLRAHTDDSQ